MLQSIIRFSVRNKLIIGLFTIALVIWGVFELRKLPLDALPDITSNQVQVITVSPTLAAPEVERLITFPLEQATANIPGITEMRSMSRFGLSVITIVFDDNVDYYFARQQVSERLSATRNEIPTSAGDPELAPATTGLGEIYQYILRPAEGYEHQYNLADLRTIQDWIVRRQLIGTPGVADVSSFGGHLKQYEVAVDPVVLNNMGVTISEIYEALQKNNENSGGSYIEKGPSALFIKTEGMPESIHDIENIPVKTTKAGTPVLIKDVAKVQIGHAVRYGALTYRDKGEVAGAVVLMLKNENANEVVKNIKEKIEEIKKTLPEGIILESFYERTKMVDRAIKTVTINLIEGALIVLLVLVIFLGNFRAGLIVASVIPLSMLFAIIMMNIFNVSGNLMSLGALDFGLIVDGAVIIVEAVLHSLGISYVSKQVLSKKEFDIEVENSTGRMMKSAVFGQIIILIVYFPILSLSGTEGKMFRPMAQTVVFALIGAFLLSLTYVPMITSLVLRKNYREFNFSKNLVKNLQKYYQAFLQKILLFPRLVVTIVLLFFACSLFIFNKLGGEFIPELEEGDFAVDARTISGSSLSETIRSSQQAVAILESRFPEIEKIVTRIGASEIPTDPMPMEMTDLIISLKPKSDWVSATSYDELAEKMKAALEEVPGLTAGFQFPVQMRFNELISGARQDVVCKIFGEDLDTLSVLAGRLEEVLKTVPGVKDLYVEAVTGLPQITIKYNRQALAKYGLTIADINLLVRTAFAGESAGHIYENERKFDLVVRLSNEKRGDIEQISGLYIPTPSGIQVPLSQLAEISIQTAPGQIQREDAKRRIIVGFNVRGRDVQSIVEEIDSKVNREINFLPGYYIRYGGQFENLQKATQRLGIAVPIALLLIFLLLFFAFRSVKYGLLIFTSIPLSAIGGILALWLRGLPFSISAGVGFIALFGVAVLNGIVLIAEFNRLKKTTQLTINQIIMKGSKTRLRPVLMTASVASLGFLPMALSQSAGAEVQRPLATVVIGGLITATILTLIVLPILYKWIEEKNQSRKSFNLKTILLIVFTATGSSLNAQQRYSLQELLQMADTGNLELQHARLQKNYWKAVQEGIFSLPKTVTDFEYGNINSPNNDTKFSISQEFQMPMVYRRQKDLYLAEENVQNALINWNAATITKEIKKLFYQLVFLEEQRKILKRTDSIYSKSLLAAKLRFETGETDIIETSFSESNLELLRLQLSDLEADFTVVQLQLQFWLNNELVILPDYENAKIPMPSFSTNYLQENHPEIQYYLLQQQIIEAEKNIEKTKLLPELTLGYNNQSFRGYYSKDGISDILLKGTDRFHSFNLSLGIPIFNTAVKSRIKGMQFRMESSEKMTALKASRLQAESNNLLENLKKVQNRLEYYEGKGLGVSEKLIASAGLSFENGNISYTEWALLINNAVQITNGYLQALNEYNNIIIELEYLLQK